MVVETDPRRIDLTDSRLWRMSPAEREPVFAALRAHRQPTFHAGPERSEWGLPSGPGFYGLVTHAEVTGASGRPEDFQSGQGAVSVMDLPVEFNENFGSMINTDRPKHTRLRRIVGRAFSPQMLKHIQVTINRLAGSLVGQAIDRGAGNFVADIAAPLPLRVICSVTGVPESEYDFVLARSNRILGAFDPEYAADTHDVATNILTAGGDLTELLDDLVAQRLANPRDDLVTALAHANVDGESLTRQEIASFFILLLVAGNETTRHAITHGWMALAEHPDQRALWHSAFDEHAATAVEEIVRWAAPVGWMRRTVARECELAGHSYREGDRVLLFYASANRDEKVFAEPYRFDLTRSPNPHVGYGARGPHYCLGTHLARLEITAVFRELLRRRPSLVPDGPPVWLRSSFINGIKHMNYRVELRGDFRGAR